MVVEVNQTKDDDMTKQWEQPNVAIDVVPVRFQDGEIKVALGERKFEPFKGYLALPGVLLLPTETIDEAAYRALQNKTGIEPSDALKIVRLAPFDNTDRDPRGATISLPVLAIISSGSNSENSVWQSMREFDELPFDHYNIVEAALSELNLLLWRNSGVTRAIVGDEFSTTHAINVTEAISSAAVDRTNFNRTLKGYRFISKVDDIKGAKGRPASGWRFN